MILSFFRYQAKIAQLRFQKCRIVTVWLEAGDYPVLLGCCDLGVSLHYSSSGLDLPMKVLDMFGAGMPVCAVNFACLDELVQHGVNGLTFELQPKTTKKRKEGGDSDSTSSEHRGRGRGDELAEQLFELFGGWPTQHSGTLEKLREGVRPGSWDQNWRQFAMKELFA